MQDGLQVVCSTEAMKKNTQEGSKEGKMGGGGTMRAAASWLQRKPRARRGILVFGPEHAGVSVARSDQIALESYRREERNFHTTLGRRQRRKSRACCCGGRNATPAYIQVESR